MDIHEILEYLPHRYPFLLIDRVVSIEPGKSIHAYKNVTINGNYITRTLHNPIRASGAQSFENLKINDNYLSAAGANAFQHWGTGTAFTVSGFEFKTNVVEGGGITLTSVTNGTVTGNYSANSAAVTPRAPVGTITIEGERGTGNDSNRVYVTGVTTNLVGQKVIPYYRFPGQTGFTAGTGERTVDANGQFSWQRKTGKRIVVQFRFGDLRSNNAIIEAR